MRAGRGRGAATDAMVRSAPVVSCQARFTGSAAARKNRRARSVSPSSTSARLPLSLPSPRGRAHRVAGPWPAFLALWTSPATGPPGGTAECPDGLIAAVTDPELLVSAMRETSPRWNEAGGRLFRPVRPGLLAVLEGLRTAAWQAGGPGTPRMTCAGAARSCAGHLPVMTWCRWPGSTPGSASMPGRPSISPKIPLDDQLLSGHAQSSRPLPSGRAAPGRPTRITW
jgi:hypothetical protein